mgnify:CR=1 FL=1
MKKFLSIITIFTLSFYILVEFIGDRLIKNILEDNISSSLNREVSIKKLSIDYLSGEARANNIKILNKKFDGKIQTNISKIKNYCKAEEYHQKYIEKNK